MELYKRVIEVVDANLIYCLIPIILTLILVELFFKNRFETKKALNLIRWTIIIYAVITWSINLVGMAFHSQESVFVNLATRPNKVAYWIMFLSSMILPISLFIKKLASKFWFVILVAFCMKIGFYFERYVIIVTSFHRDYLTEKGALELMNSLVLGIGMLLQQGIIIAVMILGMFEINKKKLCTTEVKTKQAGGKV